MVNKDITISIVLPSYNAGEELITTVNSIVNQSYTNWKLIIKDAMSSDGSLDRIPEDERIIIIRSSDEGIFDGINQGLDYIEGDYVTFMFCGDPYISSDILEKVVEHIKSYNGNYYNTVFYGNACARYEDCIIEFGEFSNSLGFNVILCHAAMFFPIHFYKERKYDTKYMIASDYEYYIQAYKKRGAILDYMPFPIVFYKGNGFSENSNNIRKGLREYKEIRKNNFSRISYWRYSIQRIITGRTIKDYISTITFLTPIYREVRDLYYKKKYSVKK